MHVYLDTFSNPDRLRKSILAKIKKYKCLLWVCSSFLLRQSADFLSDYWIVSVLPLGSPFQKDSNWQEWLMKSVHPSLIFICE